ncbi:hypothetical protein V8E51_011110 [Hyaloscypha variabilis]
METLPVESIIRIFENCDGFPQVVALASVCKQTHAAWVTNPGRIIWSVATSQIPSFDDALMAVRATAIVLKAYQAGTLPPAVVAVNSLSGNSKLPDLAELKEVLNVQYLVRCIEYMYFYSRELHLGECSDNLFQNMKYGHYPPEQRRFPQCLNEDIPGTKNATIDSFRDGFYRAMYRLLLAGAVLARAYMAPLFRAKEEGGKDGFFARVGLEDYAHKYWDKIDPSEDGPPREEDVAYIRQFPVYNYDVIDWSEIGLWRNREYETCFGPFASWIVEDGRKSAVRELILLLVVYDHFNYKTVSIMRFGVFQIEQVTMPAVVKDLINEYLFIAYHLALEATMGLLNHRMRNRYLNNRENPGPPAMLELWHFALRRYLNLGFRSGTFWMPRRPLYTQSTWWKEVGRGEIFINPNWAVVQKYKSGVISWDHEST